MENLASISVPFNILSHLVENPVPLVILVTNMKRKTRGTGIDAWVIHQM
jgi:hypothetical protein